MGFEDSEIVFNGSPLTYVKEARVLLAETLLDYFKKGRIDLDKSSLFVLLNDCNIPREPIEAEWTIEKDSPEYNNMMRWFNELKAKCRESENTNNETLS